jgi:hypothetical protein
VKRSGVANVRQISVWEGKAGHRPLACHRQQNGCWRPEPWHPANKCMRRQELLANAIVDWWNGTSWMDFRCGPDGYRVDTNENYPSVLAVSAPV